MAIENKRNMTHFIHIQNQKQLLIKATLLYTRIKTKENTSRIRIQSIIMVKTLYWIQHSKKNRSKKKMKSKMEKHCTS